TAHDIWISVKETSSETGNDVQIYELMKKIQEFRQGSMSVSAYFSYLCSLCQELEVYDDTYEGLAADVVVRLQKKEDEKCVYQFLMGLNPEFDIVRQNILQKDPLPTLQQAYALVHKEDNQQRLYSMTPTPTSDHSALITSGSFQPYTPRSTNKSHVRCDYCGKPYHLREQCWKLHGKPLGIGKGVNKGWSKAHKVEVIGPIGSELTSSTGIGNFVTKEEMQQLIKDMINLKGPNSSHVASSSFTMSSTSYPFSDISSHSSPWIIDLGASDHMIGCSGQFDSYKPCSRNHVLDETKLR
ncbi:UBN2_3 domain-containing protein, partial [Cephalotus follicularis]